MKSEKKDDALPRQTVNSLFISTMSNSRLKWMTSSRETCRLECRIHSSCFHPRKESSSSSFFSYLALITVATARGIMEIRVWGNSLPWKLSLWATVNGSRGFHEAPFHFSSHLWANWVDCLPQKNSSDKQSRVVRPKASSERRRVFRYSRVMSSVSTETRRRKTLSLPTTSTPRPPFYPFLLLSYRAYIVF